jgi:hypothetical protein
MKLFIVTVFDKGAAAYNRPFFVPSLGLAIRGFQDELNREAEDNPMFKHPSDFELYSLGSFDDNSGEFTTEKPHFLTSGSIMISGA